MSTFSRRDFIASAAAASAIPLIGTSAHAQCNRPTKPIRIIAGYPAGGQTDLFARTYGEYIRATTGDAIYHAHERVWVDPNDRWYHRRVTARCA